MRKQLATLLLLRLKLPGEHGTVGKEVVTLLVEPYIDRPAMVKWTWQSGGGEVETEERDFSKAQKDPDGAPFGYGEADFMPISEANGSVTLRILSVQ